MSVGKLWRTKRWSFFASASVSWRPGVRLQLARWHSCQQWGWPAIRSGQRVERWADYWVLSISWRRRGVCWHYYPRAVRP